MASVDGFGGLGSAGFINRAGAKPAINPSNNVSADNAQAVPVPNESYDPAANSTRPGQKEIRPDVAAMVQNDAEVAARIFKEIREESAAASKHRAEILAQFQQTLDEVTSLLPGHTLVAGKNTGMGAIAQFDQPFGHSNLSSGGYSL